MTIDAGGVWSVDGDEGHPSGAGPFLVASLTEKMCPLQKGYYAGRHSDKSKVNARLELKELPASSAYKHAHTAVLRITRHVTVHKPVRIEHPLRIYMPGADMPACKMKARGRPKGSKNKAKHSEIKDAVASKKLKPTPYLPPKQHFPMDLSCATTSAKGAQTAHTQQETVDV